MDWGLLAAVLALCLIGLSQIYSATSGWTQIVQTQIYGILLGLVALAVSIAKHVIETYFAKQEGRSLPTLESAPPPDLAPETDPDSLLFVDVEPAAGFTPGAGVSGT